MNPELVFGALGQIDWRWLIASVTPFISFWGGYRLGLRTNRITQINTLLERLRPGLRRIADDAGLVSPPGRLDADVLHQLTALLGRRDGRRLSAAAQRYREACDQWTADAVGQPMLHDPAAVRQAASVLLALLAHRRA